MISIHIKYLFGKLRSTHYEIHCLYLFLQNMYGIFIIDCVKIFLHFYFYRCINIYIKYKSFAVIKKIYMLNNKTKSTKGRITMINSKTIKKTVASALSFALLQ